MATMKRWNALGRTVLAGSKAKEIIVPIFARKPKDDEDEEAAQIGFKGVRRIFPYSQENLDFQAKGLYSCLIKVNKV